MKSYKTLLIALCVSEVFIDIFLILRIGLIKTLFIFAIVAVVGFFVAKKFTAGFQQHIMGGMSVSPQVGSELLGNLCKVLAGLLIIIPGFVTDLIALALLFKPTRKRLEPIVWGLMLEIAQNIDQSALQKVSGRYGRKW